MSSSRLTSAELRKRAAYTRDDLTRAIAKGFAEQVIPDLTQRLFDALDQLFPQEKSFRARAAEDAEILAERRDSEVAAVAKAKDKSKAKKAAKAEAKADVKE